MREDRLMMPRFFPVLAIVFVAAGASRVHAINLSVTPADVERALALARGSEVDRARFHAAYITPINRPEIERVEIITELRRIVSWAEDQIKKGDRMKAYSARLAQEAAEPWKRRVAVLARLRFHPLNTYVDIPKIEITLDGPRAQEAFIGILKEPLLGLASGVPGEHVPILGSVAEGVFDAELIGQTQRTATARVDGKIVATVKLDFATVE